MGRGKTNKRKGSDAERYFATLFKEMGFEKCITARLGGRIYDNAGIDLINIPLNIQIKGGVQKGMIPGLVLQNMREQIDILFPKDSEIVQYPLFVIHRPKIYKNTCSDDKVYFTLEDLKRLQLRFTEISIGSEQFLQSRSKKLYGEFKNIIVVSFETFQREVLSKFLMENKK